MNRYEKAARNLASEFAYAVHVEWAPANREYVVNGRPANSIREARKIANREKHKYNRYVYI